MTSLLAVFVVITFFAPSSDSSLVIDIITAGGNQEPPVIQRAFWAELEGVVDVRYCCSVVVWWRYTAAITTGLSFSVILLGKCLSLHKGLAEYIEGQSFELSIKGFKTRKLRPKPTAKLPTYGRRRFW